MKKLLSIGTVFFCFCALSAASQDSQPFKSYQNYDFVPGDKILFEDQFITEQDGEFPSHWKLENGQAVINKVKETNSFVITDGNFGKVSPRMKTSAYLTDPFTVECDYIITDGNQYGINIFLASEDPANDVEGIITFNGSGSISTSYFTNDFRADYPDKSLNETGYLNTWHHIAIIYKNKQIKCYLDQYRVLVMPDISFEPRSVKFGGIASAEAPVIFSNVKIASGGGMNVIGKKFTEYRIITHGINFDIDKATIKPESMGTLNMIVQVMKDNADLKFEVGGHTDKTGSSQHNATLSQQRAEAVKAELVKLGVSSDRLTTKGYGDTKPISDNDTPEGKANNRRVEFVKLN